MDVDEPGRPRRVDPFASSRQPVAGRGAGSTASARDDDVPRRAKGNGPLSVEEALRIRNAKAEPAKPVFLTKAERAQRALEQKQRAADEMRQQREAEVQQLRTEHSAVDGGRRVDEDHRRAEEGRRRAADGGGHGEPRRRRSRSPDSPGRSSKHRQSSGKHSDRYRPVQPAPNSKGSTSTSSSRVPERRDDDFVLVGRPSTDGTGDRVLTDKEREAIRQRYLVGDQVTARARQQGSRKVRFDWDTTEDTSRDMSDLYQGREAQQALFGRGHIAGTERKAPVAPPSSTGEGGRAQLGRQGAFWDERHWSEKTLDEMSDRDWRIFKEDYSIACKGGGIPRPYRSWAESNIPRQILRAVEDIGYREPTPIQRQAIPIGLQNRDLIGIAETGSGKTASFLIPMLAFIMTRPPLDESNMGDGPYALILAPTRELAQQIESETQKFARRLRFRSVSIVGGHDIEQQAFALRHGAEIIIATPGRLRDCIDRRVLVLNQCTYVVMDEVDRMVDMGFEEDVNFILDALPVPNVKPEDHADNDRFQYRQTTMFSATMPAAVERLARRYLRKPATVTIGIAGKAVDTVEQRAEFIASDDRRRQRLLAILGQRTHAPPIIVFVNQKKNVDLLGQALAGARYSVATLHGGKTQEQRELALAKLRSGEADVLVATDVAGRGIDVKDVSLVVNYDMAKDIESYTHRIGRTGREGKKGLAITFLNPADDRDVLYDLRKAIAASPVSRCPPELASHEAAQAPPSLVKSAARGRPR
ncbi:mRNA splicing protein prp28 [Coemansia biformis]|uniref:RNA helicase n=1 Tax=Coemansia biformis TaxID=1286918 RepID=A0A9W8CX17_9FUNG|nr:mRNA splicing protein prp28 [Coemansia biformis]